MAGVTIALERPVSELLRNWGWKMSGGTEGASALMATVTGSMITIAGVVFSMTLVALSLTSSQLGPRVLRNFMRDTTTQVVLGMFVATFLYCLLVLRTIGVVDGDAFVPHVSIAFGVLLAVVSVGVLIYFIHHVSVSIQANEVVARVGSELIQGIDRLYPAGSGQEEHLRSEPPDPGFLEIFKREARPVCADGDGYLQLIDREALVELAVEMDLVIRIELRTGHYIVAGRPLVQVWPGTLVNDKLIRRINSLFALGHERMPRQDVEFMVNQLVEIAVRALSPGLNDPFTAIASVDRLGSGLCRLVQRDVPAAYIRDEEDRLRIIDSVVTFPTIADTAFNQIRQYGRSSASVTIRMLEIISVIGNFASRPEDLAALVRHAEMIARGACEVLSEEEDRKVVEKCRLVANQLCCRNEKEKQERVSD